QLTRITERLNGKPQGKVIIDILVNLFEHGRDLRVGFEVEQARDIRKLRLNKKQIDSKKD
ncbi:hypothetical protein K0M31_000209, partial [Melipona bicolor]